MRVISFVGPDSPRLGIVEGDVVVDLTAVDPAAPRDLREVLRAGRLPELERLARRAAPDARRPLDEVQLGLPVACPGKVYCLGLNQDGFLGSRGARLPDLGSYAGPGTWW